MPNENETFGIISMSRLIEGFVDSSSAKLSTLWFDCLLFEDYWSSPNVSFHGSEKQSFSEWVTGILQAQGVQSDTIKFLQNRWRGIFDAQQEFDIILGPHKELPTEINRIVEDTVKHEVTKSLISEGVHPIDITR
jgi:hypothetical protein